MNSLEKEFTLYEEALALKELGFDEPCFGFYLEDGTWTPASYSREGTVYPSNTDLLPEWCTAPTCSQAFRFFREKYDITQTIARDGSLAKNGPWAYTIVSDCIIFNDGYLTYEEAELACLRKLIEMVKHNKTT